MRLLFDSRQEHALPIVLALMFRPFCEFLFYFDHFLLEESYESQMFLVFLLLFRVHGLGLFFLLGLLFLLELPHLFGKYLVIELILKLEAVEFLDEVLNSGFYHCDLFVHFVIDVGLVYFLLVELDHQNTVLIGTLVEQTDAVHVDSLIEHHILDLPLGLAHHMP